MAFVVLIALALTMTVYILGTMLESFVVSRYYRSESTKARYASEAFRDLEDYIESRNVSATDTAKLQDWVSEHDYTTLQVSDNTDIQFSGGWLVTDTGAAANNNENMTQSGGANAATGAQPDISGDTDRINYDTFKTTAYDRIITFADGDHYVRITTSKEQGFSMVMFMVRIILCVITLAGTLLIQNSRTITRIIKLSEEVQEVSDGDLKASIDPTSNDEIGRLAENVDKMRDAIVDKLRHEKEAWDANTQLITAMSHDIRTPLTSLIGYLDIIESGKYKSKEEAIRYVSSSRDKALQLKELSDKLFQYFLVFGSHDKERELETFDAGILLQQLISEHSAELIGYGFAIDFEYRVEGVELKAELSSMRRLFDNVFSNIMKYADKSYHVRISADIEDDRIVIRLINRVLAVSRKVESNNIGLKTCEKICRDMDGSFSYTDDEESSQLFTVRIALPATKTAPGEQNADVDTGAGTGSDAEEAGEPDRE